MDQIVLEAEPHLDVGAGAKNLRCMKLEREI